MKIIIPSAGKTGVVSVGIRQPRIADLRKAPDLTEISGIRKNEFLRLLLEDPEVLKKITHYDRDYLFLIAISVVTLNVIKFGYDCPVCKKRVIEQIAIGTLQPVFLKKEENLTKKITINKQKYTIKVLTAYEEELALEYASEDDDTFNDRLEDAKVCLSIGLPITLENISKVLNTDLMLYYVVDFFNKCMFHGTMLEKECRCSCGVQKKVIVKIDGSMLSSEISVLMERYVSISSKIDYMSFLELTIPEYNTMITAMEQ